MPGEQLGLELEGRAALNKCCFYDLGPSAVSWHLLVPPKLSLPWNLGRASGWGKQGILARNEVQRGHRLRKRAGSQAGAGSRCLHCSLKMDKEALRWHMC